MGSRRTRDVSPVKPCNFTSPNRREVLLGRHPEVPYRMAELDRTIEHEEELERQRNLDRLLERRHPQQLGVAFERGTGLGIDL